MEQHKSLDWRIVYRHNEEENWNPHLRGPERAIEVAYGELVEAAPQLHWAIVKVEHIETVVKSHVPDD